MEDTAGRPPVPAPNVADLKTKWRSLSNNGSTTGGQADIVASAVISFEV